MEDNTLLNVFNNEIKDLEDALCKTDDFMETLAIKDRIHNLKMQRDGVKPMDSSIDCVGCGS